MNRKVIGEIREMNYMLMHKDIEVAEVQISEVTSEITTIGKILSEGHLPLGVKGNAIRPLNRWWKKRAVPESREGIEDAIDYLKLSSLQEVLLKSHGFNLTDHYWVKRIGENIEWKDCNFFTNDFSEDIGKILFGKRAFSAKPDDVSPDPATNGYQSKRWIISDGKRLLLKAGNRPARQEPFNEILAGYVADRLSLPYVKYELCYEGNIPFSQCETFINPDTEFVTAKQAVAAVDGDYHAANGYSRYLATGEYFGVNDVEYRTNQMIVLDYIIANEDRHQGNFGFIRNPNTLKFIGVAPIFDSGNSMYFTQLSENINMDDPAISAGFEKTHALNLKHIEDFRFVEFDKLRSCVNLWNDLLGESKDISQERRTLLCKILNRRIDMVEEDALSHTRISKTIGRS
jgi:hypothetical protein